MIELLIDFLKENGINLGFFRLYNYITFRAVIAMATSMTISLLFGFRVTAFLYRHRMRDTSGGMLSINTASKAGTPTSGGILIVFSAVMSCLFWCKLRNPMVIISLAGLVYFALVGLFDDWQKVKYKSSLMGLSQKVKTIFMLIFIVPFAVYFVSDFSPVPEAVRTQLYLPFYKFPILDIGAIGYTIFIVFVFFSIVNSLNITDGLDGLLSGTAIMTIAVYAIFAYIIGNSFLSKHYLFYNITGIGELTVFLAVLIGSLLGFLWFNSYPAEVFMGDTGSLSIGAALSICVCFTKQEFLFLIAGGIFFFEILSSFLQEKVGNRIGRRIFYRAPIHHTFIHSGMAEPKTVIRFWILSLLLSFIALLSIKIR